MIRHTLYITIILLALTQAVTAQKDFQIEVDTPYARLQILMGDTVSASPNFGLGSWELVDSVASAFQDRDWYKLGGTLIPTNSDSAYRSGYTLLTGLQGGLATKIELLKDGVIQFDQIPATATGRYNIKFVPQQIDEGNTDWNFTIISQPNSGIDRNNDVYSHGFNLNPGGGVEVANKVGFGEQFEHFYRTSGSDYGEWHIVHIDTLGTVRKPISWFLNHYDPSLWAGDFLASEIQLNDPTNNLPYAEFERSNTTSASFKLLGSAAGQGAEFYLDEAADNMQITSFGLTNPHMYLFDNVAVSYIHMNYLEFLPSGNPATSIVGRDGGNLATTLTYAALADSLDYRLMDHDWYEVGGTTPPNAITDEMYHSGNVSIGLSDPDTRLHVAGTSADPDNADESRAMFILEGNATNALLFGSGVSAPYGSWIQSGDRNNPGTPYGIYLNPLGGNVGIGNQDPQQDLHVTGTARITASDGTATAPMGRDADGDVSAMTEGYGINYTSGAIEADTNQLATPYDLTLISGGATDLTIGGAGPYTIESSTGTDVTVSPGTGISLSESPANTLVITNTVSDTDTRINIEEDDASVETNAVTLNFSTGLDAQESPATQVNVNLDLGEFPADATMEGDEEVLVWDTGSSIEERVPVAQFDQSTTNEAWTLDADDITGAMVISSQTLNVKGNAGIVTDIVNSTVDSLYIAIDGDEFTTVTTAQADDYILIHDENGASADVLEKMLWSDFVIDLITFKEDNASEGSGNTLDVGTGIDLSVTGSEADYSLDFNEFTTDAAPLDGDEFVILYDPSGAIQEKTLASTFGGADGNFAEDNLTWSANRTHQQSTYTTTLQGSAMSWKFEDTDATSGATITLEGNVEDADAPMGAVVFQYTDTDFATDQAAWIIVGTRETDSQEHSTLEVTASEATSSPPILTWEENQNLSDNTQETNTRLNSGIAYTQSWESASANAISLDRGFYNVVLNSGHTGTITLPEIFGVDETNTEIDAAQVPVGQEYVISNYTGAGITLAAFNGAATNDDYLNGIIAGTISMANNKSYIVKAIRLNGTQGYWSYWISD